MFTKEILPELQLRWHKIQEEMKRECIDACLLASSTNLFYAAGRVFNGYIYINQNDEPLFFARRPAGMSGTNVLYIRKPEDIVEQLSEKGYPMPASIALEGDALAYNEYVRLQALFPELKPMNASTLLREVRAIKTHYEIERLRESGIKHAAVYAHVQDVFSMGMTDLEMSVALEGIARNMGNLGIFRIFGSSMEIFMGSVLAGDNANTPSPYDFALGGGGLNSSLPVGANGTILRPGMTLMIDLGGNFTGYMTDMSRVYSIGALNNQLAKTAHQLSIDIVEAIKQMAKPGVEAKVIYELALEMVKAANLESYFMGYDQQAGFIGHGVGIEINEIPVIAPRSKHILRAGMTFALEPKFVIPGVGAVGIEDTFVVTEQGLELLTNFTRELQELS